MKCRNNVLENSMAASSAKRGNHWFPPPPLGIAEEVTLQHFLGRRRMHVEGRKWENGIYAAKCQHGKQY